MLKRAQINPFGPSASNQFEHYGSTHQGKAGWLEPQINPAKNSDKRRFLFELNQKKVLFWWLAILFGLIILLSRILFLQTVSSTELKAIAEGNRIRIQELKADRGIMYDRYGNSLVKNIPSFSLAIVPVDLPKDQAEKTKIINDLAKIVNQPALDIAQLIEDQPFYSYQPVIIKANLDQEERLMAKLLALNSPGVILKIDSTRQYLVSTSTPSLSHVLGYLGRLNQADLAELLERGYSYDDYIGKAGLELSYEDTLRGQKGREQVEVDATGNTKDILARQEASAGSGLVLTIDIELQRQAEQVLSRVLAQNRKTRGAVVALDPNSGEVLALVSYPTFDNNLFSQGISQEDFEKLINNPDRPLFNRSISGQYPSGSTFKMVVAAAALQEGLINRNTGVNSIGGIAVSSWFFPDWKAGGHGWTTVIKALAESVNTFFYTIGGGYNDLEGLGIGRINKYAQEFGISKLLGIDLPNEAKGFIPSQAWKEEIKQERWYIGDTYNLSIGQGDILVTPLQVAAWTSVFANNGILYQPHVVREIVDDHYNVVESVEPKKINENFIDQENIDLVKQGLLQATISGSAKLLYNLPIAVGAKTGTAQWSSKDPNHAWITTFAPYQEPQIVLTVLVEEGGEGSTIAQPVAYEILRWWAENR